MGSSCSSTPALVSAAPTDSQASFWQPSDAVKTSCATAISALCVSEMHSYELELQHSGGAAHQHGDADIHTDVEPVMLQAASLSDCGVPLVYADAVVAPGTDGEFIDATPPSPVMMAAVLQASDGCDCSTALYPWSQVNGWSSALSPLLPTRLDHLIFMEQPDTPPTGTPFADRRVESSALHTVSGLPPPQPITLT